MNMSYINMTHKFKVGDIVFWKNAAGIWFGELRYRTGQPGDNDWRVDPLLADRDGNDSYETLNEADFVIPEGYYDT